MNKTSKSNFIMGEMDYKKAIWKLAIPSIGSFLVVSLYITIDRLMISQFVGPRGLAAIQYFQPSLTFVISFLIAISTGTKILFSILNGKNDEKKIKKVLSNGFILSMAIAIFVSLFMFFIGPSIPSLFGAQAEIAKMASIYFLIFSFGIIPQTFVNFWENMFTVKGYTKIILLFTIISQFLNLSMDYIFMGILKTGIEGAAIATVLSMYISCLCFFLAIIFSKKEFIINPFKYKFFGTSLKKIIKIGIPASFSQIILAIKFMLITYLLTSFNDENLIIIYSATMAVLSIFFIPFFGFSTATLPIMGYNFGSKNYLRIKKVWKYKIKVSLIYFISFIILFSVFPRLFLSIFNAGHFELSATIPRIITSFLWVLPFSMSYGFLFQSVGNVKEALYLDIARNILIFVPIVLLFRFFNHAILLFFAFPFIYIVGIIFIYWLVKSKLWKSMHENLIKSWKS